MNKKFIEPIYFLQKYYLSMDKYIIIWIKYSHKFHLTIMIANDANSYISYLNIVINYLH